METQESPPLNKGGLLQSATELSQRRRPTCALPPWRRRYGSLDHQRELFPSNHPHSSEIRVQVDPCTKTLGAQAHLPIAHSSGAEPGEVRNL